MEGTRRTAGFPGLPRFRTRADLRPGSGIPETVVAVVVGLAILLITDHHLDARHYLFIVGAVVAVALTTRWPLIGAVLALPVLPVATYLFGGSGILAMVIAAVTIEVIAARGLLTTGTVLVIAHVALSSIDLEQRAVVFDPVGLLFVGVFFVIVYAFGYNRHSQRRRRLELQRSLAESQRQQRLTVARDLHDSVATSLTSVVMRSQALELSVTGEDPTDARIRTELEGISETSRNALEQLRAMLRVLNTELPDQSTEAAAPPPVRDALHNTVSELRAHRLKVDTDVVLPPEDRLPVDRDAVARILVEMTSNAVKHSPPRSTVRLDCRVGTADGSPRFLLSMTNAVTEGTLPYGGEDALFSTHIGLASMQSRATDAGGAISMGPVAEAPSLWRTALSLPIVE